MSRKNSAKGGGGTPFSVNFFPLTFRKILVRGGPGGGYPSNGKFPCLGFLNPPLSEVNILGMFAEGSPAYKTKLIWALTKCGKGRSPFPNGLWQVCSEYEPRGTWDRSYSKNRLVRWSVRSEQNWLRHRFIIHMCNALCIVHTCIRIRIRKGWVVGGGALRLQQVSVKPRKTAAVHRRQSEGGLLTLVNTCGEIDVCTLCTEASPSAEGEYPLWVGSGGPSAKGVVALCEW